MGGAGKSALASALAHDEQIRRHYSDGVLWLDLGREPDLRTRQAQLAEALGDRPRAFVDEQQGRARLSELLADKACLIILDNVWRAEHLQPFNVLGPRCCLMLTTRDASLLEDGVIIPVGVLSDDEALELLGQWAGQDPASLPPTASDVAHECGNLPLALAMVGAMVSGRSDRWANALHKLRSADLQKLQRQFHDYPYPNLLRAIEVGILDLELHQRDRYLQLAVFDGQGAIPESVVCRLWVSEYFQRFECQDLVDLLVKRSLVQRDQATGNLTLHDLQFDYVTQQLDQTRIRSLHSQLADSYLSAWGGLDNALLGLRQSAERDDDERYGVEHVAIHLSQAERSRDVHRLLALQWDNDINSRVGPQVENGWYSAHERVSDVAHYVGDVALGWHLAEVASRREIQEGRLAPHSIGLTCRYALIISSINSLATNVPPAMLVELIQRGMWTVEQGLSYARQVPESYARAKALAALIPHLPESTSIHVLAETLAAIRAIESKWGGKAYKQAKALVAVTLNLTAPFFPEALATARAIEAEEDRAWALAALASGLPLVDEQAQVLAEALTTARAIKDDKKRAWALAASAAYLPPTERKGLFFEALDISPGIEQWPDESLVAFLSSLSRDAQGQVVQVIQKIEPDYVRVRILRVLAPHLPDALLMEALAVAQAIGRGFLRVQAVAALAPRLPPAKRTEVLAEALAIARQIGAPYQSGDQYLRAKVLTDLAPHLPEPEREEALIEVVTTPRTDERSFSQPWAYAALAPYLPQTLLTKALANLRAIQDEGHQAKALAALAPHLPAAHLDKALAIIGAITDEYLRAEALIRLVPRLSNAMFADTLAAARAIDREGLQAEVLAALAPRLPQADRAKILGEALATVQATADDLYLLHVLEALVPHLPDALLDKALVSARAMKDKDFQVDLLANMVQHLPQSKQRRVAYELLTKARANRNFFLFAARVVPAVMPYLSRAERREVLDEAMVGAQGFPNSNTRAEVLVALAPYLPEADRVRILADVLAQFPTSPDKDFGQPNVFAVFVELLPESLFSEAVRTVRAIENDYFRAMALAILTLRLPQSEQEQCLREAVMSARAIKRGYRGIEAGHWRVEALVTIAQHLPRAEQAQTLHEALATARVIQDRVFRAMSLKAAAAPLAKTSTSSVERMRLERSWHATILGSSSRLREDLLTELPALCCLIRALGGRQAIWEAARAIEDVGRWWP